MARRASTRAKFSPACRCPVKNRAIRCPCRVDTIPEVNSPVRSREFTDPSSAAPVGRGLLLASARIFMLVSSL